MKYLGHGQPTFQSILDGIAHQLRLGQRAPFKALVSHDGWESCLRHIEGRPFKVDPVENQGVIVTHALGQEVRIIAVHESQVGIGDAEVTGS